jgi:23S rRNA pseudouridine1911/1915/1917 synthase
MLSQGRVRLNGVVCKVASHPAHPGDVVEIGKWADTPKLQHGLKIVYEDDDLLVVHKPAGLLTVATPHEREHTLYAMLRDYLAESRRGEKLYIVHRLDRFVSGLLVFAKTETAKSTLQSQFRKHSLDRRYWAIVEGRVATEEGTIKTRLAENQARRMHSTDDPTAGKEAVTHYRVLRRFPSATALEIRLETGRKNQIRVHLSELGHPIVGDRAYGSTREELGRMGLHAFLLEIEHPRTRKRALFRTEAPPEFRKYLPRLDVPAPRAHR